MSKIEVKKGDGAEPRVLVEAFIGARTFPFMAKLKHASFKPLVVPSSGINTLIPGGEAVDVKVKSFEQAWMLVTDLATLADHSKSKAEVFAEIEAEAHVEVPAVPEVADESATEQPVAATIKPKGSKASAGDAT